MGCLLGLTFSFAYALVAQTVNRLALPGIPLYQPPLGPFGNIVLSAVAGAGLGLITTWADSPAWGITLGSVVAAVAIVTNGLLRINLGAESTVVVGLFLSVPLTWLGVPVVALLRWQAGRQVEARREAAPLPRRLWLPVVLAIVIALLAGFELYGADAQTELRQMHALVEAGLRAGDSDSLPAPLQARSVAQFPAGQRAGYTLEWTNQDLDRFIELRPATSYDRHAAVIARFAGSPILVCLFPRPNSEPNCGTY